MRPNVAIRRKLQFYEKLNFKDLLVFAFLRSVWIFLIPHAACHEFNEIKRTFTFYVVSKVISLTNSCLFDTSKLCFCIKIWVSQRGDEALRRVRNLHRETFASEFEFLFFKPLIYLLISIRSSGNVWVLSVWQRNAKPCLNFSGTSSFHSNFNIRGIAPSINI